MALGRAGIKACCKPSAAGTLEGPFQPSKALPPRTGPGLVQPHPPLLSRGHFFGGLDADVGVPLAGWEHDDLVQELVDAGDQVLPVPGLVGNVAEELGVDTGQAQPHVLLGVSISGFGVKRWKLLFLLGSECHARAGVVSTHIVHHERGDGPADLVVGFGFSRGAEENEEEPGEEEEP